VEGGAETHPSARLTGSPILHDGRLYVPVSSSEEGVGSLTDYECCKFRGSIVALDAATGRQIWKTYTIPTNRSRCARTPAACSCGGRRARRSGRVRLSTRCAARST
jgi:outer membrane protein assembly factor BamB